MALLSQLHTILVDAVVFFLVFVVPFYIIIRIIFLLLNNKWMPNSWKKSSLQKAKREYEGTFRGKETKNIKIKPMKKRAKKENNINQKWTITKRRTGIEHTKKRFVFFSVDDIFGVLPVVFACIDGSVHCHHCSMYAYIFFTHFYVCM